MQRAIMITTAIVIALLIIFVLTSDVGDFFGHVFELG